MRTHLTETEAVAVRWRARRIMSKWALIAGLGLLALITAPISAHAAPPPGPSFQDSATGTGSTAFFPNFNFDVHSGPLGENPSGFATADFAGEHFESSSITCLSVAGNSATFAGTLQPNPFGFTHFRITVTDNGGPNSGLDTYAAEGTAAPVPCSTPTVSLSGPVTSGDIVVVDSPPPPTSKDECKNEGYKRFGFRNQGQCVAFVQRQPKS